MILSFTCSDKPSLSKEGSDMLLRQFGGKLWKIEHQKSDDPNWLFCGISIHNFWTKNAINFKLSPENLTYTSWRHYNVIKKYLALFIFWWDLNHYFSIYGTLEPWKHKVQSFIYQLKKLNKINFSTLKLPS